MLALCPPRRTPSATSRLPVAPPLPIKHESGVLRTGSLPACLLCALLVATALVSPSAAPRGVSPVSLQLAPQHTAWALPAVGAAAARPPQPLGWGWEGGFQGATLQWAVDARGAAVTAWAPGSTTPATRLAVPNTTSRTALLGGYTFHSTQVTVALLVTEGVATLFAAQYTAGGSLTAAPQIAGHGCVLVADLVELPFTVPVVIRGAVFLVGHRSVFAVGGRCGVVPVLALPEGFRRAMDAPHREGAAQGLVAETGPSSACIAGDPSPLRGGGFRLSLVCLEWGAGTSVPALREVPVPSGLVGSDWAAVGYDPLMESLYLLTRNASASGPTFALAQVSLGRPTAVFSRVRSWWHADGPRPFAVDSADPARPALCYAAGHGAAQVWCRDLAGVWVFQGPSLLGVAALGRGGTVAATGLLLDPVAL